MRGHRGWLLLLLLLLSCSCARTIGPIVQQRSKLLSTETISTGPAPGRVVVEAYSWDAGDVLRAKLSRELVCSKSVRTTIGHNTTTTTTTEGIVEDAAAAVLFGAGSAIAFAVSPPTALTERDLSPTSKSLLFGAGLITGTVSLVAVLDALVAAGRGEQTTSTKTTTKVTPPDSNICGRSDSVEGALVADVGGRRVELAHWSGSELTLSLRDHGPQLCDFTNNWQQSATFHFVPADGGENEITLGERDLRGCAIVQALRTTLSPFASDLTSAAQAGDAVAMFDKLSRAEALLSELTRDDPDRAALTEQVRSLKHALRAYAGSHLDAEASRVVALVRDSFHESASSVQTLTKLALTVDDGKSAWATVYSTFVQAAMRYGTVDILN